MSGKKIAGILLAILGLIGAYYYIGGYLQCKNSSAIGFYDQAMSGFASMFGMSGVCDTILQQYWPMMVASVAILILGIFLIFKNDTPTVNNSSLMSKLSEASSPSSDSVFKFSGEKSLANDSYKIFLVKKYGIEKNEALGKIICQGKLFDDTEQALQHAAEIDGASSQPSNQSGVTNLTEVQKALSDDAYNQSPMLSDEARKFGITHNGLMYCYKTYQYDELDDALKFARSDVQATSTAKQDESPSSNKMIIAVVVGVIAIIGGYFALQKNSCSDAKADVIKYMQIYANALYQGKQGMSVPGAAEAIAALEIAKKACNKPDLTVEEIINPQTASTSNAKPNTSDAEKPNAREVNDLIDRNHIATYDCGEKNDQNACNVAAQTASKLRDKGYCFGMENEPRSQWDWHRCNANSIRNTNSSNNSNASSPSQVSPSFDCSKAKSTSEKLICSDSQLANEDNQLSALYKSAKLKAKDPAAFKAMTTAAWKEREANCFDKACLLKWYASRKVVYQNIINGTQ